MTNLGNMTRKAIEIVNETHREVFEDYLKNGADIKTSLKYGYELVSEYDTRASDYLIDRLEKAFPGIPAVSEESPPETFRNLPERFWLIDPIDGTQNFVRGIEYSAISVSLVDSGSPVIGVTKDIFHGNMYSAYKGGGYLKNGKKITRKKNEGGKVLSFGFPHNRAFHSQHLKNLNAIFHHFIDMRRFASLCLDMCLLCEGRFDVLFEIVHAWDFYAGIVMAGETGLKTYIAGDNVPLENYVYFVCGEEELVDAITEETDLTLKEV